MVFQVFQNVYFLEHLHYINTGEFDKAIALIPEIEYGLSKYAEKINKARLLTFQYNIMVMYFLVHQFKESAIWAEQILEDKSEIKQEITTITRVLLPVLHFELAHVDLVENLTRAAYRYLKGKNRLHDFERLMIGYLKNMPFSINESDFLENLKSFEKRLQTLMDSPKEHMTTGMHEISLWANYRISGRPMSELIRE